ncbi:hypothetical protein M406DRAFT_37131 [Cryphonectria parasitica EP155]|uniref:Sucrose transporter n=1 Tax=Cryphonectria parasitica (strain ATCC 38755 / EP155) TaxID=660469 RepID=A0A9P4Y245_CRYP1|nr:uncharacterized protein M406DRAFT_37131 [Cryphonectria parasitica EP155]KAF3765268.1 hypothetical protein M406DRAFT_37131 [Cryphonectria parasitica EP155]
MDRLRHDPEESKRKSLGFILSLSAGWFGLQQIFTVFFGSGYFYLASLGFRDTTISLMWLSGPSAGLFFQPVIGAMSDSCTHPWGQRRPFVVIGTLVLICAMLSLAWAEEITTAFSPAPRWEISAREQDHHASSWGLSTLVTASILVANFAIQPVQLGLRAMATDLVPIHQQAQAQAWIARLNLMGSLVGYGIGSADLAGKLPFLGHSQFQILCSLVSINLAICVSITCSLVQERRQTPLLSPKKPQRPLLVRLRELTVVRRVCVAQVFCWLAWFPFLYDISKYVGGLQRDSNLRSNVGGVASHKGDMTRAGSFAMLIFASVSLVASVILPRLVVTPASSEFPDETRRKHRTWSFRKGFGSLRRIWLACQIIFCIGMMSTFIFDSLESAYVLAALTGIPWAAGTWIPFTLISQDIRRAHGDMLGAVDGDDAEDLAATVVGIHNAAISAPQIAAALGSSLLFLLVSSQGPHGAGQNNGLEVWLLRAGGLSALAGAWLIKKLPEGS